MTETSGRATAASAQAIAIEAKSEIEKHEAVCAERYIQIAKDIGSIKGLLRWVATTGIVSMLGFGGWATEQWITASGADQRAARATAEAQSAQIAFLKTQVTTLTTQLRPGQPVVVATPPARVELPIVAGGPASAETTPATP